jgi:hypothetical protein
LRLWKGSSTIPQPRTATARRSDWSTLIQQQTRFSGYLCDKILMMAANARSCNHTKLGFLLQYHSGEANIVGIGTSREVVRQNLALLLENSNDKRNRNGRRWETVDRAPERISILVRPEGAAGPGEAAGASVPAAKGHTRTGERRILRQRSVHGLRGLLATRKIKLTLRRAAIRLLLLLLGISATVLGRGAVHTLRSGHGVALARHRSASVTASITTTTSSATEAATTAVSAAASGTVVRSLVDANGSSVESRAGER